MSISSSWLRCKNCFYCMSYRCRRYPPAYTRSLSDISFPSVSADLDWCGEFVHKDAADKKLVEILNRDKHIPLHRKLRE